MENRIPITQLTDARFPLRDKSPNQMTSKIIYNYEILYNYGRLAPGRHVENKGHNVAREKSENENENDSLRSLELSIRAQ